MIGADLLIGGSVAFATTLVHGLCTGCVVGFLRSLHARHWALRNLLARVTAISLLALFMLMISVFEASLWALLYVAEGALGGFAEALYFSLVTFTTLGYGDLTLAEPWRLLGAVQAADGTITFGWTTALIVGAVHRFAFWDGGSPAPREA